MTKKLTREELLRIIDGQPGSLDLPDEVDRKAVEGYQYLDRDESAEAVLKTLDTRFEQLLSKAETKAAPTKIRPLRRYMSIAAALAVLIVAGFFLLRTPTSEVLFAQHFEVPRSTYFQQTRGDEENGSLPLAAAFQEYEMGNYAEAQAAIAELKSEHPDKPDLIYYEGMAALASDQPKLAEDLFSQCLSIEFQDVNVKSLWYLGLTHLKLNNRQEAIQWLEKSRLQDPRHREEATALLKRLQ